jgi:hypothetical protein
MNPLQDRTNSATDPMLAEMTGTGDSWDVFVTLMEAIAAGSVGPGSHGAEVDAANLPAESQESYRQWLSYYQGNFPNRKYPCAQAFLNTPAARALLPRDYLYGTSIFLRYDPLDVRILHLLDSSRFLYFQTLPAWSRCQWESYSAAQRSGAMSRLLEMSRRAEVSGELRQLAAKYRTFLEGDDARTAAPDEDYKPVASVGELGQFLKSWLDRLQGDVAALPAAVPKQEDIAQGATAVADQPDLATAFAEFSLLDLFDLAYLFELRDKGEKLRDFVKETSRLMPSSGTYCRELKPGSAEFELFRPGWAKEGLIGRIVTFPVACQSFDARPSGTDDVLYVGFCGHDAVDERPVVPRPEGAPAMDRLNQLRAVVSLITSTSLNELRRIQVLSEARHSSVAAIMGRNLSHNIGSHVLHWLIRDDEDAIPGVETEVKKIVRRRGYFLRYLRERMDYIATITRPLAWWSYSSPLSAVVAPLTREVPRPGEDSAPELVLLLDNIGRSDNVFDFDIRAVKDTAGRSQWPSFQRLNVALPHGAAGRQAFYTIIENVIRNSAKHQPGDDRRKVTLGLDADPRYPEHVKVLVKDGVTKADEATLRSMQQALHGWICDREGRPLMKQLGFKEMRISAAFLRMIDPAQVDDLHDPDLIGLEESEGLVAHVFFMLKARDVLFVTALADGPEAGWQRLKDFGIGVMAPGDDALSASLRHRFTVLLDDEDAAVRAWAERAFGPRRPLPVRSFRVDSLPERKEGCRISREEARELRGLLDRAVQEAGSGESVLRVKEAVYDLWLHHNFGEGADVQIAVFGAADSWVRGCEGGLANDANPFKDDGGEVRVSARELATLFPPAAGFDPQQVTAVFAHHGALPRIEAAREDPKVIFAQDWSGGSPSGTFLLQTPEPSAMRLLMREMREAVLSKVLIIDERLAADPPGSPRRKSLACAGIELIGQEFPALVVAGAGLGIAWPWRRVMRFDYVSIHFGLIEKSARDLHMDIEDCKKALLARLGEIARVVLVHSGRGRPDLPPGVRYIDLSSLESLLNEDKRTLVIGLGGV